ncbi:MAG: hypothetical protein ABI947_16410 [Chloroflexota bacterium]
MTDNLSSKNETDTEQMIQVIIAEHYNLQSARSATISESNGRAALYLTSVSSGVVALAFVGQRANNEAFLLFALVLFPALFFLGFVTFVRVLETSIEDMLLLRGITRIHHYYTEVAPEIERYLVMPIHDDWKGVSQAFGITFSHGQLLLTAPGMISVINGILAGCFSGLVVAAFIPASNLIYAGIGIIVFVVTVFLHTSFQYNQRQIANTHIKPLFPSPTETEKG